MATKITRKVALSTIIAFAESKGFNDEDVLEVVKGMLQKLETPSKKSGESAAHKSNAKLLAANLAMFDGDKTYSAREFANNAKDFPCDNTGRPSVHKATAVLVQGVNDGILVKAPTEKKSDPMRYKRA